MPFRDYDHDELDQAEYPEPDDRDETADTVPCPFCHAPAWVDADLCPSCGMFIAFEEEGSNQPWWWRATACVCLGMVLLWIGWGL